MVTVSVRPFGFTSKPLAPISGGLTPLNGSTTNLDTHEGILWPSRGFKVFRKINAVDNKACYSFLHAHTDGTEYVWYSVDASFYPETGSDSPAAFLSSGVTASFGPVVVNLASPAGISVYFNGTNSEAQGIQVESSNLNDFLFDSLVKPGSVTITSNSTGGALSDDTYYVKQAWVDSTGALLVEGEVSDTDEITISGGTSTQTLEIPEPASKPTRATGRRIYIGTTDSLTTVFLEASDVSGAYSHTTGIDGTAIPPQRNGLSQTAVMPLANVDVACEHLGRLFIASTKSNEVYWSERDAPNQWYSTNGINAEADGGWNGHVRGLLSMGQVLYVFTTAGIFAVYGTFQRDTQGSNALFSADVSPPVKVSDFRCVGHNTIAFDNTQAFFMSTYGIAVIRRGGATSLVAPDDFVHSYDCLDFDYATRWVGAIDPVGHYYCLLVTRLTNSSRPQDGAGTAGIPDRIMRYDLVHGLRAPDLNLGDITHISGRRNGTKGGSTEQEFLMAMSPMGRSLELHYGWSGGGPDDISGATYDGLLATSSTTTSATVTLSGVGDGDLIGQTVTLFYPTDDSNYPGVLTTKTVSGNTTTGGSLTVNWNGALTAPSGTEWTVRIAGLDRPVDWFPDPAAFPRNDPRSKIRLKRIRMDLQDVQGAEAVS